MGCDGIGSWGAAYIAIMCAVPFLILAVPFLILPLAAYCPLPCLPSAQLAGVVTNLLAGLMGARWGIKTTLLSGLTLQLAGIGMLFGWQNNWNKLQAILYVTAAQLLCGISKDLVKLGGKTVTKLVTPEEKQGSLFRLVSFITGMKNSLKGAGYLLGAATVGIK